MAVPRAPGSGPRSWDWSVLKRLQGFPYNVHALACHRANRVGGTVINIQAFLVDQRAARKDDIIDVAFEFVHFLRYENGSIGLCNDLARIVFIQK